MLIALPSEVGMSLSLEDEAYFNIQILNINLSFKSSTLLLEKHTEDYYINNKTGRKDQLYRLYTTSNGLYRAIDFNMPLLKELRKLVYLQQSHIIKEKWKCVKLLP